MTTYRLNFIMWRVRLVLQLLTNYYLWMSLIPSGTTLFGYSQSLMLTYILGSSFLWSVIMSSRSGDVGEQINSGDLSNYLVRPINFFIAWFTRDIGDKAMNISFSLVELSVVIILLRPPVFLQTNFLILSCAILAVFFAILLNFFFNLLIGSIGFWTPEVWGPRFIFFIIMSFFAGGLFPLDIFPKELATVFYYLPFGYLLYFPLKVYLGQLPLSQVYEGLLISFIWTILLYGVLRLVWKKGLNAYQAEGK